MRMESAKSTTACTAASIGVYAGRGIRFAGAGQVQRIHRTRLTQRGQQWHEHAAGFARAMQADHRRQLVEAATAGNGVVQVQLSVAAVVVGTPQARRGLAWSCDLLVRATLLEPRSA